MCFFTVNQQVIFARVYIRVCLGDQAKKNPALRGLNMAEGQGFEPWELLHSTVFKTAALGHSATPPN